MLIDTHCHLDFPDFDNDREAVIERARQQGIGYIINIGSSLQASKNSIELAQRYDFIYATLGLHPHEAENFNPAILKEINLLVKEKKVVAIGEIGLDYYFREEPKKDIKILQEKLFRDLIGVARENELPLVIHNRNADFDLLSILKSEFKNKTISGVVHCFSSDEEFLHTCLSLGFCISFTCNITYKKADNLRNLIKATPLDKLLLETDAPFLPPQIYRGKKNEPANVEILAQEIAKLKGVSFNEVADRTTRNAKDLFCLS
jgi:TatD DNase family protein